MSILAKYRQIKNAMNISFTEKQEAYIKMQMASGDYQNASEVVRDAIRIHQTYRNHVIEDLKVAIEEGWEEDISKLGVAEIVKKKVASNVSSK